MKKLMIQFCVSEDQYAQIGMQALTAGITRRNGGANVPNLMRGLLSGEVTVYGAHEMAKFRISPVGIPAVRGGRRAPVKLADAIGSLRDADIGSLQTLGVEGLRAIIECEKRAKGEE